MLPSKPKNIKSNYNSFILLKFYDKEKYVDDLQHGKLFMRSLESFATMKDVGRGDKCENKKFIVYPGENNITQMNYVETKEDWYLEFSQIERQYESDEGIYFAEIDDNSTNTKIYSLYALWFDSRTGEFDLPNEKMMNDFGDYCCVIFKPIIFFNRVSNELSNSNIKFVEYINIDDEPIQDWNPFFKDKKLFHLQNECRIVYETLDNNNDYLLYEMDRTIIDI